MISKSTIRASLPVTLLLSAIAAWVWLWFFYTPVQADDLAFQSYYLGYLQRDGSPAQAWWDFILWHRGESNGRLGDFMAPLVTTYLPRWLFAALSALAVVWILRLVTRMILSAGRNPAGRNPAGPLRVLLLLWPVALVLWPWRDYLSYPVYSLNYIYSTALTATGMWLWVKVLDGERRVWVTTVAAIVWLLGGMTHEGVGAPMLLACGTVILTRRSRLPLQAWVIALALAAGTLESSLAPGTLRRAGFEQLIFDWYTNTRLMFKHCTLLIPLAVMVVAMGATGRWRPALKAAASSPVFIMAVVNLLGGAAICFKLDLATPRYGWVTQVYATVAIGVLACRAGWLRSGWATYAGVAASVAAAILMAGTIAWQKRFYDEETQLRHRLASSPTGTVFADVMTKQRLPIWLLRTPTGGMWQSSFQHKCYNFRFPRPDNAPYAVVPADIAGFAGGVPQLPGNVGALRFSGYLLGAYEPQPVPGREYWLPQLVCTLADGSVTKTGAEVIPFTAADGRRYVYLGPVTLPDNTVKIDYEEYPL